MKIGIPKEIQPGETRVALVPAHVNLLTKDQHTVLIEKGAGQAALFSDAQYEQAGATIVDSAADLYAGAEVVFKVQPPFLNPTTGEHEAELVREGTSYIGFLDPFNRKDNIEIFTRKCITGFAMEFIPRLTRTQNMDALSSMATLAGYKAVLVAAARLGSIFPLLSSAAGTLYPAKVLVLGAGVSGLQAIATAHRLGALVEAFDPRPVVKEQVGSLGALFIEMALPADPKIETASGYANQQSEEFLARERETISARLAKIDVVICTAQVFGKAAPRLLTREMLDLLKPGAVVIDLAIEQGGNCELAEPGKWVEYHNVAILGAANLPATLPVDASTLYSRNLCNFFTHIFPAGAKGLTLSDEITWASCATHAGRVVNPLLGQKEVKEGSGSNE